MYITYLYGIFVDDIMTNGSITFLYISLFLISLSVGCSYEKVEFPISLSKSEAVSEYTDNNPSSIIRILIIGDANDNFAVQDWCKADPQRALHTDKTWWKRTTYSASKKCLSEYLKPFQKRNKSWELRLCESSRDYVGKIGFSSKKIASEKGPSVLVASMMNKFGVKVSPPFNRPVATLSGLDGKEAANFTAREDWTIKSLFQEANAPALRLLCDAMGGLPDAVMVHSMHQDLSHPPEYKQEAFLTDWERGMHHLFQTVKDAFPNSPAFFTRTGNKFAVQDIEGHWNTNDNLNVMQHMNANLQRVAKDEGYSVLDFAAIADPSWFADKMRASYEENVDFVNALVTKAENKATNKQKLNLKKTFERARMASKKRKKSGHTHRAKDPL